MKRIYNANLGILLIIALVLAACGGTETAPAAQDTQPTPLSAADLGLDTSELSTQAPGDDIEIGGLVNAAWSLGIDLPTGPGGTEVTWVLRHFNSLAQFNPLTVENFENPTFRRDGTWRIVRGLATDDASCLSIESTNFPGSFLRHSDFRVRLDPNDDSALFAADATWCTRFSLDGRTDTGEGVVAFESFNFPDYYMRRLGSDVWLARPDGASPANTPNGFAVDTTWGFYVTLEPQ